MEQKLTTAEVEELRELYDLESRIKVMREVSRIEYNYFRRITAAHGIDAANTVRFTLWRKVAEARQKREREGENFSPYISELKSGRYKYLPAVHREEYRRQYSFTKPRDYPDAVTRSRGDKFRLIYGRYIAGRITKKEAAALMHISGLHFDALEEAYLSQTNQAEQEQ